MIQVMKAEFRKILTVRSTYLIALFALALGAGLIGFWIFGFKDVEHAAVNHKALQTAIFAAAGVVGILVSFIAILSLGHEYRYNTIMYSLTSSNRRGKVFLAKLLAIITVASLITLLVIASIVALFYLGQNLHHVQTTDQYTPVLEMTWRIAATIVADVMFAYIIVALLRSLVGAVGVLLVLPSTIEPLLTLLLKENTKYLPYTAIGKMTQPGATELTLSLVVAGIYALVGGMIAYLLFLRRDAN